MSNIPGLNEEESEWVCNFFKACANHKKFTEKAPTERAVNYVTKETEIIGY